MKKVNGGKPAIQERKILMYNYLIVGSGLCGAVMAQQLHAAGKKVLVIAYIIFKARRTDARLFVICLYAS